MIKYGSSAIADVKFGSRQVDRIYHGSDLVWEHNPWTELHIGSSRNNDPQGFIIGGSLMNQNAEGKYSSSGNGFEISSLYQRAADDHLYNLVDGNLSSFTTWINSTSTATSSPWVRIKFPFDIYIQSITLVDSSAYTETYLLLRSGTISVADEVNGGPGTYTSFATISRSKVSPAAQIISEYPASDAIKSAPYRYIRISASNANVGSSGAWGQTYNSTYKRRRLTEVQMVVKVRTTDYYAWKSQYGLSGNTDIV